MLPENVLLIVAHMLVANAPASLSASGELCVVLQPCIVGQTFSNSSLYYQTNQTTDANFTIALRNGAGVGFAPWHGVFNAAEHWNPCIPAHSRLLHGFSH